MVISFDGGLSHVAEIEFISEFVVNDFAHEMVENEGEHFVDSGDFVDAELSEIDGVGFFFFEVFEADE